MRGEKYLKAESNPGILFLNNNRLRHQRLKDTLVNISGKHAK
jgi:hypothetical protein